MTTVNRPFQIASLQGSFSLLEDYKDNGQAGDRVYTCLLSEEGCTKKKFVPKSFFLPRIIQQEVFFSIHSLCRYNHRNFCIHMATSHGFVSVAQIMARWLHSHWSSPLLLQNSDFSNELLQAPSPWHEDGVGKSVPRTPTCHRIVFCN